MYNRLVKLLKEADENTANKMITDYEDAIKDNADYLLAKGVIVPPCKVGDFVEWKTKEGTKLYRVNGFYYDPNDRGLRYLIDLCTPIIDNDNIVRIITKEEHEKSLA